MEQGKRLVGQDGHESVNDMFHENRLLQAESQTLRTRVKALQETVNAMTVRNTELQAQKAAAAWSKAGSDSDVTQMVCHHDDWVLLFVCFLRWAHLLGVQHGTIWVKQKVTQQQSQN